MLSTRNDQGFDAVLSEVSPSPLVRWSLCSLRLWQLRPSRCSIHLRTLLWQYPLHLSQLSPCRLRILQGFCSWWITSRLYLLAQHCIDGYNLRHHAILLVRTVEPTLRCWDAWRYRMVGWVLHPKPKCVEREEWEMQSCAWRLRHRIRPWC